MALGVSGKDEVLKRATAYIETAEVETWHINRYLESLNWLHRYLINSGTRYVLETGGRSGFSGAIVRNDHIRLEHASSDLRYEINKPSRRYDLVISMEVLEHINDVPSENIGTTSTWLYSGMRNYLSEIKRVLKSRGVLFLTTPNVCSATPILNILNNISPFSYPKHIRELSPAELRELIDGAGFKLIEFESLVIYQHTVRSKKSLEERGINIPNLGDTLFVLAAVA